MRERAENRGCNLAHGIAGHGFRRRIEGTGADRFRQVERLNREHEESIEKLARHAGLLEAEVNRSVKALQFHDSVSQLVMHVRTANRRARRGGRRCDRPARRQAHRAPAGVARGAPFSGLRTAEKHWQCTGFGAFVEPQQQWRRRRTVLNPDTEEVNAKDRSHRRRLGLDSPDGVLYPEERRIQGPRSARRRRCPR